MKHNYIGTDDQKRKPWGKITVFIIALFLGIYAVKERDATAALISATLCLLVYILRKAEMEQNTLWNSRSWAAIVFRFTGILAAVIWVAQFVLWFLGVSNARYTVIAILTFYGLMFISVGSTLFVPKVVQKTE